MHIFEMWYDFYMHWEAWVNVDSLLLAIMVSFNLKTQYFFNMIIFYEYSELRDQFSKLNNNFILFYLFYFNK